MMRTSSIRTASIRGIGYDKSRRRSEDERMIRIEKKFVSQADLEKEHIGDGEPFVSISPERRPRRRM